MIKTKHLRQDLVEPSDGTRIYAGRKYPRGVEDNTLWSWRNTDLGPSAEIHVAILSGRIDWPEYERRFLKELKGQVHQMLFGNLAERSARGETITLLCDHPRRLPREKCHRFLLKELVDEVKALDLLGQAPHV